MKGGMGREGRGWEKRGGLGMGGGRWKRVPPVCHSSLIAYRSISFQTQESFFLKPHEPSNHRIIKRHPFGISTDVHGAAVIVIQ